MKTWALPISNVVDGIWVPRNISLAAAMLSGVFQLSVVGVLSLSSFFRIFSSPTTLSLTCLSKSLTPEDEAYNYYYKVNQFCYE